MYVYSVGTKTLLLLHSLHAMTCGPHWSGSSSTRAPLLERSGKDRGGGPASSAAERDGREEAWPGRKRMAGARGEAGHDRREVGCRYPEAGIPSLTAARQDLYSYL